MVLPPSDSPLLKRPLAVSKLEASRRRAAGGRMSRRARRRSESVSTGWSESVEISESAREGEVSLLVLEWRRVKMGK